MTRLLQKLKSLLISKEILTNFEQACNYSHLENVKFYWRKGGLQFLVNQNSLHYFLAACLSFQKIDDPSRCGVINFLWQETNVKLQAHKNNNLALIIAATLGDEATFFQLWALDKVRSAQQDDEQILLAACLGNCFPIVAALSHDIIIQQVTESYCALILERVSLAGNLNIFKLLWQHANFKKAAHLNDNNAYLSALCHSHKIIADLLWQEEEVKKLAHARDNLALYYVCRNNYQKNFAELWQNPEVRRLAHLKDNRALMASCNIDSFELFKQIWQEAKVRQSAHVNDNRLLFYVCCPYPNTIDKPIYSQPELKYFLMEMLHYIPLTQHNEQNSRFVVSKLLKKQTGLPETYYVLNDWRVKIYNFRQIYDIDSWFYNYERHRSSNQIEAHPCDDIDLRQIRRFNVYAFKLVWQEFEVRRLAHLNDNFALFAAINNHKHECIDLLWQQLEVRNTAQISDNRALEVAMYRNNLSMFKKLWQQPLVKDLAIASLNIVKHTNFGTHDDVSFINWLGYESKHDLLYYVCKFGATEMFHIIWEAIDKNILLRTSNNTYFLQACFNGHSAIVALLWQSEAIRRLAPECPKSDSRNTGTEIKFKRSSDNCAFNVACLYNYVDIAKLLWQSPEVRQKAVAQHNLAINHNPIRPFLINDSQESIDRYFKSPNSSKSFINQKPLIAACFKDQQAIIDLIIESTEFRPILHLADNRLFLLACEYGWIEVVQKLWQLPLVREQAHTSKNLALFLALSLGNESLRDSLIGLKQGFYKSYHLYNNNSLNIGTTTKLININNQLWRNWQSHSGSLIAFLLWQEPLVRKAAQLDYAKLLLAAAILPEPAHYQAIYQEACKLNLVPCHHELKKLLSYHNFFDVFKLIECQYVFDQLKALLINNNDQYIALNFSLGVKLLSNKADFNKYSAIIGQELSLKFMRWYTNKYQASQLLLPMRELKTLPIECCNIILSFLRYEQDWLEFVVKKEALGGMANKVKTFKILSSKYQGQALLMQFNQALELKTSSQAPSRPLVRLSAVTEK